MKKFKLGFTLIELLIVIALLGTLAVALLAALDPLEQIKKGTDTGLRNTVTEVHGAFTRYFASRGQFPWGTDTAMNVNSLSLGSATLTNYILSLTTSGELKENFASLLNSDQKNRIFAQGTANSITVCFLPKSKGITNNDANTKWTRVGTASFSKTVADTAACHLDANGEPVDPAGTAPCFWCVQ